MLTLLVSAPRPSHFLFARAKEKVTKEKARPTSGPGCAGVPSFRRCSAGRHEGASLPLRSSLGVLPRVSLRNASTRPPDGNVDRVAWKISRFVLVLFFCTNHQAIPNAPFRRPNGIAAQRGERHGCRERTRRPPVKGHRWPLRGDPRSGDGMREVSRSETRMAGARLFGSFWRGRPSGRLPKGTLPAGRNHALKQLANWPGSA
ncbi:hypothetical protein Psest_1389 [Stutzerimonas stutzeri RCH2]|uniref:Uncharacterized protein n=1 Tax=Stutzerimonas stutzeri RCH2 TaxID=644801 RepID=L0GKM3_STUST|nr:hypothetical protein Psest_1389 [Stutzerimonas stutzeri RCH2]